MAPLHPHVHSPLFRLATALGLLWILQAPGLPAQKPTSRISDKRAAEVAEKIARLPRTDFEPAALHHHVSGRVVDGRGRPLAGVKLLFGFQNSLRYLPRLHPDPNLPATEPQYGPSGITDVRGRFYVRIPRLEEKDRRFARYLMFRAHGHLMARVGLHPGFGALRVGRMDLGTVVLPRGRLLKGRVHQANGRPIAKALVIAEGVARNLPDTYEGFGPARFEYFSVSLSDKKGRIRLRCPAGQGIAVTVRAPGYYNRIFPYHDPRLPLVVRMTRSGFVSGFILDHEDHPAAAGLLVESEVGPGSYPYGARVSNTALPSVDNGSFRLSIGYRHRFRVRAFPYSGGRVNREADGAVSANLDGPKDDLEIRLPAAMGAKGGMAIRATDKQTGKPIPQFRAAVLWDNEVHRASAVYLEALFCSASLSSNKSGVVTLPGPGAGEAKTGTVIVRAQGYAPRYLHGVAWDDGKPPRIQAKLQAQVVFVGRVVDEGTGKPVRDAMVWLDWQYQDLITVHYGGSQFPGAVRTDADGRFRIEGLGKGKHLLYVWHPDRPVFGPRAVVLGPRAEAEKGTQKPGSSLAISRGLRWAGRVRGKTPAGCRIRVKQRRDDERFAPFEQQRVREVPIGRDGSFAFHGLAKAAHDVFLLVPDPLRPGRFDPTRLASFTLQLRRNKEDAVLDLSGVLPGQVRGKLITGPVPPPFGRLAVIAHPTEESRAARTTIVDSGRPHMRGFAAVVGTDGSFNVLAPQGEYRLHVVDLVTGALLVRAKDRFNLRPAQALTRELTLDLAAPRITLVPERSGGKLVASLLVIKVDWSAEGLTERSSHPAFDDYQLGIPLADLADRHGGTVLYLPAGRKVTLEVYSAADRLRAPAGPALGPRRRPAPLAARELVVRKGDTRTVRWQVPEKR